ncbi:hypothetical protein ACR9GP_25795, partial [Enterobacter ludwigii]
SEYASVKVSAITFPHSLFATIWAMKGAASISFYFSVEISLWSASSLSNRLSSTLSNSKKCTTSMYRPH